MSASERAAVRTLPELLSAMKSAVPEGEALAVRLYKQLEDLCGSPDDVLDATTSFGALLHAPTLG